MKTLRYWFAIGLLGVATTLLAASDDPYWPRFRGPQGDGHSSERGFPVQWNATNVIWKTKLKGEGQSSPIIWKDRIYLTSALDEGRQRLVIAVDRKTGEIVWERVAWKGEPEPTHRMNGWASATCVTDGQHVYASFGYAGLHCYTMDGKHVWSRNLGKFLSKNRRGTSSSLVVNDSLVFFNGDSESDPFLFGIDKLTGKTVWKTDRPKTEGYSTPLLIQVDDHVELVLNGHYYIAGYDPQTGKRLWWCKSFNGRGEPSPAYADGVLFVVNGLPADVYAVRPGGSGDVTKSHMVWHTPRRNGRDQPSPIVVGNYLFVSNMAGTMSCYDTKTGKEIWRERFSTAKLTASPVAAEGRVYFLNEKGETFVFEPGPQMKIVAKNTIGAGADEIFRASPALYQGQIFLRSNTVLYCIGKK